MWDRNNKIGKCRHNVGTQIRLKTVGLHKVEHPVQPNTIEGPTDPLD